MNEKINTNNLRIRRAVLEDITQISLIERQSGFVFSTLPTDFLCCLPEDIPLHNITFYEDAVRNYGSWVAEVDSKILGFICVENIEQESSVHISELAVDYGEQRKGIGRKLLDFIIKYAQMENKNITLTTFSNVPWNADFYKTVGLQLLHDNELNDRLKLLLKHEVEIGLPKQYRCAMRLAV